MCPPSSVVTHPVGILCWHSGGRKNAGLTNKIVGLGNVLTLMRSCSVAPVVSSYVVVNVGRSGFPGRCKRLHTYVKRPFVPGQTFKLSTKASDSKNFKRPKFFRLPQILSLEISGPKVVLVLLCKFSLYRAVRAPIGAWALKLHPHQPHGWSGPLRDARW